MLQNRLVPLGAAILLFFLTILGVGPGTQWLISRYIRPGVIETASAGAISSLFQGTLLQAAAIKSPDVLPLYGSSELFGGARFNPSKLFAGRPTGWVPYLVGHAGSTDLIQALYTGAQDLKGKKIAISLSAQWFSPAGVSQKAFAANFSALQAYKALDNPLLTEQTKADLAKRLLQFNETPKNYPILSGLLRYFGHPDLRSQLMEALYWFPGRLEMAALEIQDANNTIKVLTHLPQKEVTMNASDKPKTLPSWVKLAKQATADVRRSESNNPYGINNNFFRDKVRNPKKFKNSASKGRFFPSPEYSDLNLVMQVLKDEGAKPIFIIQPVNGFWYDFTGFPKYERQKYYTQVRAMCAQYGYALADFSGHEYDKYFMNDPSHPSEKGWLDFDAALDKFFHQKPQTAVPGNAALLLSDSDRTVYHLCGAKTAHTASLHI